MTECASLFQSGEEIAVRERVEGEKSLKWLHSSSHKKQQWFKLVSMTVGTEISTGLFFSIYFY